MKVTRLNVVRLTTAESMRHLSNPSSPLVKLLNGIEEG
jgi:hypothetical protein